MCYVLVIIRSANYKHPNKKSSRYEKENKIEQKENLIKRDFLATATNKK
ncbi:hypothetical protein [Clostridium taeniosporum]|nr:hypothetical protein [Clostridium taeniosporum]